jgi:hypothetical protein
MHSEEDPKPDPSLEALAARLRALPQSAVPANLEVRLLAAIEGGRLARVSPVIADDSASRRQAWLALASTVLALAMVGLLSVFGWQGRGDNGLVSVTDVAPAERNSLSAADEWTGIALSPLDRRMLSSSSLSSFHWPVQETRPAKVSSAIRGELLD